MTKTLSRRGFLAGSALAGAAWLAGPAIPAAASGRALYSPILMYHRVGSPPRDAGAIRRDLTIAPDLFAAHLDMLAGAGYQAVSMAALWAALADGAEIPAKPVVLTFDDGYDDAYRCAYPLLARRSMTGMFYLITGFIGQPGYLTWAQAAEMRAAGMEMGNHSVTHHNLRGRDHAYLMAEIDGAASAMAGVFGERPRFFCYPLGHYDSRVIAVLRETGHLAATTIFDGTLHAASYPDAYRMPRVRIHSATSVERLAWLLNRRV